MTSEIAKIKARESINDLFLNSWLIRTGAEFKKMLDFVGRLKQYKPFNNFLVYMQNPDCVYYATRKDWLKKFHRYPKAESRPMVILAPMSPVLFVYDINQTDGPPVPKLLEGPFAIDGEVEEEYFQNLIRSLVNFNIKLHNKPFNFNQGGRIFRVNKFADPEIELNPKHSRLVNFATLIHELAHLFLGHLGSLEHEFYPDRSDEVKGSKRIRELEAESVAYLVLLRFELKNKAAEYLAFYNAETSDLKRLDLDLILNVATRIENLINKKRRADV